MLSINTVRFRGGDRISEIGGAGAGGVVGRGEFWVNVNF